MQHPDMATPWPLPQPDLYTIGDIIVLRDRSHASGVEDDIEGFSLTPDQFAKLIFCERGMHQKAVYADNISRLRNRLPRLDFVVR